MSVPGESLGRRPQTLRLMTIAVYAMALVLVVGAIVVLILIGWRLASPEAKDISPRLLALEDNAEVRSVDLDGDRIMIMLRIDDRHEIRILNWRKGTVEGRVAIGGGVAE